MTTELSPPAMTVTSVDIVTAVLVSAVGLGDEVAGAPVEGPAAVA